MVQLRNPSFRAGEKLQRKSVASGVNMLKPLQEALEHGLWVRLTLMNMEGNEEQYILKEVHVDYGA